MNLDYRVPVEEIENIGNPGRGFVDKENKRMKLTPYITYEKTKIREKRRPL